MGDKPEQDHDAEKVNVKGGGEEAAVEVENQGGGKEEEKEKERVIPGAEEEKPRRRIRKGGKEYVEGSIDVVCVLDDQRFVSGGDSG
jgi:hypothetical protein